jgi:hypothetical protein
MSRLSLLLLALCSWLLAMPAAGQGFTEYQLKAGVLYNFIAFTTWPEAASPVLNVCIYGPDPFGREIDALQGRKLGSGSLAILRASNVEALAACHVVFIGQAAIGNLPRVLEHLANRPVLTVADTPGGTVRGIVLNMEMTQGRLSFRANLAEARARGLSLSSKLLRLASEVVQ